MLCEEKHSGFVRADVSAIELSKNAKTIPRDNNYDIKSSDLIVWTFLKTLVDKHRNQINVQKTNFNSLAGSRMIEGPIKFRLEAFLCF